MTEGLKFDMACPVGCGRRWDLYAKDAHPGVSHTCPGCGASFRFDDDGGKKIGELAAEFQTKAAELEAMIKGMKARLKT